MESLFFEIVAVVGWYRWPHRTCRAGLILFCCENFISTKLSGTYWKARLRINWTACTLDVQPTSSCLQLIFLASWVVESSIGCTVQCRHLGIGPLHQGMDL